MKRAPYLGTTIDDTGNTFGITKIKNNMKELAKKLKKISTRNPSKAFRLSEAILGGVSKFYRERINLD